MQKRITKTEIYEELKTIGINPEYLISRSERTPYLVWFFADTFISGSDTYSYIATDDIKIELGTSEYDAELELKIIDLFRGCEINIARAYNPDEEIHISEFTVKITGKI